MNTHIVSTYLTKNNQLAKAQIPLGSTRTRYLAHAFWHKEVMTCCVALGGQHGTTWTSRQERLTDTCSGVSPQRRLGWTCPPQFVQKMFLRLMQIQTKLVHAITAASLSSAMLAQEWCDTHDSTSAACRTWRAKWNLGSTLFTMRRGPNRNTLSGSLNWWMDEVQRQLVPRWLLQRRHVEVGLWITFNRLVSF